MESLRILVNELRVAEQFNTDYNQEFTKEFAVGETVRVKNPQRFLIRDGLSYSPQPINRNYTTVTVDQIFGVDFEWDSVDAALKQERGEEAIRREYLKPAMAQIAQEIDSRAALWAYQNTNNIVGVLGTNPTSVQVINQARARMQQKACPPGDKRVILTSNMQVSLSNAQATIFNPTTVISETYRDGLINTGYGFRDWYESQSLYQHTAGTWAGTVEMNSAGQAGGSITVTATNGDTFFKGDVFNIAGVYAVNPSTRRSTGVLQEFVILQDTVAAGGAATLSISPAIVGPGSQYQNVDSLPANGADLTLFPGTASPNGKIGMNGLALHRDAFALVGVKLEKPTAAEISVQSRDPKTGIAIRFVRMFDPQQSKMINRFDVLLGFGNLYPDSCAVRVLGGL